MNAGDLLVSKLSVSACHESWTTASTNSNKRPDTLSLSVRLRHQTAEIYGIAQELALPFDRAWQAGDLIKTKGGDLNGSKRTSSYASAKVVNSQNVGLFDDALASCIRDLRRHKDAIRSFVNDGGTVECLIGWFFDEMSGLQVRPEILAGVGELGITLTMMVYAKRDAI